MEALTHAIDRFVTDYVYVGVFVLMLLESACIPIPSEVTMLVGGYVVQKGDASFVPVVALGVLGNLVGSLVAYWVGLKGGRPLALRYGRYVRVREHDVDRAERWFDRYGEAAVFFSRLLPIVRTFISLPAGIARMSIKRFSLYTTVGCVPWVALLAWAGYLLGSRWHSIVKYFTLASVVIAAVLVAVAVRWWLRRRRDYPATIGGSESAFSRNSRSDTSETSDRNILP